MDDKNKSKKDENEVDSYNPLTGQGNGEDPKSYNPLTGQGEGENPHSYNPITGQGEE
jgi:hypothetical protein